MAFEITGSVTSIALILSIGLIALDGGVTSRYNKRFTGRRFFS